MNAALLLDGREEGMLSSEADGPRTEQDDAKQTCWLLEMLPIEVLDAICTLVLHDDPSALTAWCLTCSTFNAVCSEDQRERTLCFVAAPALFGAGLSPLFSDSYTNYAPRTKDDSELDQGLIAGGALSVPDHRSDEAIGRTKISWRLRAQLLRSLPCKLLGKTVCGPAALGPTRADGKTRVSRLGRIHVNYTGETHTLLADSPFVCTNRRSLVAAYRASSRPRMLEGSPRPVTNQEAKKKEECEEEDQGTEQVELDRFLSGVMFRGVDYFEMSVLRNGCSGGSMLSIAIAMRSCMSKPYSEWVRNAVRYRAGGYIVQGDTQNYDCLFKSFATCAVVGFGVDWDCHEVFVVVIDRAIDPMQQPEAPIGTTLPGATTQVFIVSCELKREEWYPAVGTMSMDKVMVNFGQEAFWFDVKTFIEKKRSGKLNELPSVAVCWKTWRKA